VRIIRTSINGNVIKSKHQIKKEGEQKMKKLIYLTLAIMLIASFTLVAMPQAAAATINVGPGGSIQDAINAANDGDTIRVAAGTYYEIITWDGVNLTIIGAGPGKSIIDGSHASYGSVIWINDVDNSRFEGFTIRNGSAEYGGGMDISNDIGELIVENCRFEDNEAGRGGGGVNYEDEECADSPTFINCTFVNNTARCGGGMRANDHATLIGCTFDGNTASSRGGGMVIGCDGDVDLKGCTFKDNEAGSSGGGIWTNHGEMTVDSCTFKNNEAVGGGGGDAAESAQPIQLSRIRVCGYGGGISLGCNSEATVVNSVFYQNEAAYGGGISDKNGSTITNCTFYDNWAYGGGGVRAAATAPAFDGPSYYGGGLFDGSYNSIVTNCIFWNNYGSDENDQIYPPSAELPTPPPKVTSPTSQNTQVTGPTPLGGGGGNSVTYSDVMGGYDGTGNIDQNPSFVNSTGGDFHLQNTSPCIDKGTNGAPALPTEDFEGDDRICTDTVDMGADEFCPTIMDLGPLPDETHTLEIIISPEGTGTVDLYPGGLGIYGEGQSVKLTAEGIGDYSFSSWSGDFTGSDNPDNITMDTDKVVTANFALPGQGMGSSGNQGGGEGSGGEEGGEAPQGNVPVDAQGVTTGGVAITGGCLDCNGKLIIPEGTTALDAAGNPLSGVTVQAPGSVPDAPDGASILGVCDFGPDGATFNPAITINMNYEQAGLTAAGLAPEDLTLAYYDDAAGEWTRLPGMTVVNFTSQTVSGAVGHFTTIAVIGPWSAL